MTAITVKKATELTGRSDRTLRRDISSGKVSATRDGRGHIRFDKAELGRVYGEMKTTGENGNGKALTGKPDRAEIIAIKDNRIADLHKQLERAEMREDALITEKGKLLELVSRMQVQTERMALPGEVEKKPHWVQRLLTTLRAQSEQR